MKKNRQITSMVISLFILTANALSAQAYNIKQSDVQTMVQQKTFRFKVQTVLTSSGPERNLKDNSVITVNDTVFTCYLPNYTGLDFTSSTFDYKIKRKKNRQIVTIENRIQGSDQFLFYLHNNDRYGTLTIMHPDGSGITFRGLIVNKEY